MKTFVVKNTEEIILIGLIVALGAFVTYNALTYGIIDTGSFSL